MVIIWAPGRNAAGYTRLSAFNLDQRIQFTFAHELSHVLTDANPELLAVYKATVGGTEENMVNEIAEHAIS